jgi:Golgi nucleoside diphosphatase
LIISTNFVICPFCPFYPCVLSLFLSPNKAITEYLYPLIEFAETVLHTKHNQWSQFPIYLKATAGMRLLEPQQRVRVIDAVRHILGNSTYSSFKFETEYARVISGEEEAIYGWAGTNFVLGSLLQNSQGSGTVKNPKLTHGALEMGGASAQISFYQDNEDIMSNLFKLQIGQGKHWNVYAHSHLCFGMNEAWNRMGALLAFSSTSTGNSNNDVPSKIYNPCLAGGSSVEFESSVEYEHASVAWRVDGTGNALPYTTMMTNPNTAGDYDACTEIAHTILNKQYNAWCNFSHHGDCSFSGVYQPQLPVQSENFGEFLAFSNYYHIWDFLKMPLRSSLSTLQDSTRKICAMNVTELDKWNGGRFEEPDTSLICFRAVSYQSAAKGDYFLVKCCCCY